MRTPLLVALAAATSLPAVAAEPYRDDRSDPAALVESLYNAIDRKEYARAWSYFAEPPAATPEDYARGFEGTESVAVRTGAASAEGAAGSTFYSIPVAIEARQTDGETVVFAGCYELRLANPQVQGEDFRPLHVVKGTLARTAQDIGQAVPASCGNAPPPAPAERMSAEAKAIYRAAFGTACTAPDISGPEELEPQHYEIGFNYMHDEERAPMRTALLYQFLCNRGAYNESHVYVLADDHGDLRPLGFATPTLDIRYGDDDDNEKVDAIYVTGFRSVAELTNASFDAKTMTLTSFAKWRGVGDASASGTWIFRDGAFALVRYDVDASYDGEENPQTVVDYLTGP